MTFEPQRNGNRDPLEAIDDVQYFSKVHLQGTRFVFIRLVLFLSANKMTSDGNSTPRIQKGEAKYHSILMLSTPKLRQAHKPKCDPFQPWTITYPIAQMHVDCHMVVFVFFVHNG
jgi:hypothetical protein